MPHAVACGDEAHRPTQTGELDGLRERSPGAWACKSATSSAVSSTTFVPSLAAEAMTLTGTPESVSTGPIAGTSCRRSFVDWGKA